MTKISLRFLVIINLASIFLAGCTLVRIGDPYNQEIDDQINAYHKQALEFIKTMEQLAGKKGGEFDSDAARKFYAQADSNLQNIQIQANALSDKECHISNIGNIIARILPSKIETKDPSKTINLKHDTSDIEEPIKGKNCTSVLIYSIIVANRGLEKAHKSEKWISNEIGETNERNINKSVLMALRAIRSRK